MNIKSQKAVQFFILVFLMTSRATQQTFCYAKSGDASLLQGFGVENTQNILQIKAPFSNRKMVSNSEEKNKLINL